MGDGRRPGVFPAGDPRRYHAQRAAHGVGRFTVDAAHDAAVTGMLESLDVIQDAGVLDRVLIMRRGPDVVADIAGTARRPRLRDVVTCERARRWSRAEFAAFTQVANDVQALIPDGHDHHQVLAQLRGLAHPRVMPALRASFPSTPGPERGEQASEPPARGSRRGQPRGPDTDRSLE